jgi:hypothetical protein
MGSGGNTAEGVFTGDEMAYDEVSYDSDNRVD